jgi:hypothetical protein
MYDTRQKTVINSVLKSWETHQFGQEIKIQYVSGENYHSQDQSNFIYNIALVPSYTYIVGGY